MAEEFDFDEYESLPETASTATHMIGKCNKVRKLHLNLFINFWISMYAAGSMAGVLEHCVMYPVDSVKVNVNLKWNYFSSVF